MKVVGHGEMKQTERISMTVFMGRMQVLFEDMIENAGEKKKAEEIK